MKTAIPFQLASLALALSSSGIVAAPTLSSKITKAMGTPLSPRQKQLQTDLWRTLDTLEKPTAPQLVHLETLLKKGAPLNAPDPKSGLLPLMVAVCDQRLMTLFLKYGAKPNLADKDGATPLHIAAMMGAPGTVKQLIQAGGQLEQRNNRGETALVSSSFLMADISNTRDLIRAGAKLDARDNSGMSALSSAAILENGAPRVRLLLDAGAKIDIRENDGTTPLIAAALMNRADTVELLLQRGANSQARDKRGQSALDAAQTLAILGAVSAQSEARKLTPAEQKTRANAKRIVQLLERAARTAEVPRPVAHVPRPVPGWKSGEWPERRDAARSLGQSRDPKALPALLWLLNDPEWIVREAAINGLGALWTGSERVRAGGSPSIIQALMVCTKSPLGQRVTLLRSGVVNALASIGDAPALVATRSFLADPDAATRLSAMSAVVRSGDREALPILRQIAQHDTAEVDGVSLKGTAEKAIAAIEKGGAK